MDKSVHVLKKYTNCTFPRLQAIHKHWKVLERELAHTEMVKSFTSAICLGFCWPPSSDGTAAVCPFLRFPRDPVGSCWCFTGSGMCLIVKSSTSSFS
jgi:hypothetical protein